MDFSVYLFFWSMTHWDCVLEFSFPRTTTLHALTVVTGDISMGVSDPAAFLELFQMIYPGYRFIGFLGSYHY